MGVNTKKWCSRVVGLEELVRHRAVRAAVGVGCGVSGADQLFVMAPKKFNFLAKLNIQQPHHDNIEHLQLQP